MCQASLVQSLQIRIFLLLVSTFGLIGCEGTNLQLATEAGIDAAKAVTLSDEAVRQISTEAAAREDATNRLAQPDTPHSRRLARLTAPHQSEAGLAFDLRVYLDPKVNAFAMADGSIRIYSGLMEMMTDDELRFVIGHEIGHVAEKHIRKKLILAYAGQAVRKGVASQEGMAGDLAASLLGEVTEQLLNAQFSQQEEREADDFGLRFLEKNNYNPHAAVSALKKLAALGDEHSFLASHPAPGQRAERLLARLNNPDLQEQPWWQTLGDEVLVRLAGIIAWLRAFPI